MTRKGRPTKKLRRSRSLKDNVDRISILPESILSHILSLLPTKDALRTSVLSREWKYKWTSIYNLDFDDQIRYTDRLSKNYKSKFMEFVEKVLLQLRYSTVKDFKISCVRKYNQARVRGWISNVLRCNVQRLHIWWCEGDLVLPQLFFSCASVTEMVLGNFNFKVPTNICYSNLRFLLLSDVQLLNSNFPRSGQLLLTFPTLEVLVLHGCEWVNVKKITIDAPLLSRFQVIGSFYKGIDGSKNCKVEICGGNLTSFFYSGSLFEDFVISNPSRVGFVTLWHIHAWDNDPHWKRKLGLRSSSLLGEFSAVVRSLNLSGTVIEALQHVEPSRPLSFLNKVTELAVTSFWDEYSSIRGGALLDLLNKAPDLETIVFFPGPFENPCRKDANFEGADQFVSATFLSRLTYVRFQYFYGRQAEIQLVMFLLRNAMVLEDLKINSEYSRIAKVELSNLLMTFPKASGCVSITVC